MRVACARLVRLLCTSRGAITRARRVTIRHCRKTFGSHGGTPRKYQRFNFTPPTFGQESGGTSFPGAKQRNYRGTGLLLAEICQIASVRSTLVIIPWPGTSSGRNRAD